MVEQRVLERDFWLPAVFCIGEWSSQAPKLRPFGMEAVEDGEEVGGSQGIARSMLRTARTLRSS